MAKKICPLIKDECLEYGCHWHVHLVGTNPQTGEPVDTLTCAISSLPLLLIETSKHGRETAAKVDNFRELATQVVRSNALRSPTPELQRLIGISEQ